MKQRLLIVLVAVLLASPLWAQVADKAENVSPLLIGETIPEATVYSGDNQPVELSKVLKQQPTVLVFYRGGWCPYCNLQLAALGESLEEIKSLGFQLVAISPEDPRNIKPTVEKDKIAYTVYSDPKGELLQKVGIAFATSEGYLKGLQGKTIGEVSKILPVPTVMLVNTDGEILFEYISPNYKKRISKELLVAAMKAVK